MSATHQEVAPVAEAVGVTKRFGSTVALRDVTLRVLPGETHALVGRNGAGKSTLVSVLTGLQQPDSGEVRFGGAPAPALADRAAWRRRVACVYQKPTIVPRLTVAENLFLHRHPTGRGGVIRWGALRRRARALLDQWGVDVSVDALAGDLSVADRQLVEIARALSEGARFIILDEPTAQLGHRQIARLFDQMRALQAAGVTFLFISHHLQEVYEICQRVTVLRDARRITTAPVADLPGPKLVEAMTGEVGGLTVADAAERERVAETAPAALEVEGLSGAGFTDVSFTVRAGEVVGIAGTGGSGKIPVAESIAGLHRPAGGRIRVHGRDLVLGDVRAALAAGVGCVPRDRHHEGFVPELSVAENATLTISDRLGPYGLIRPGTLDARARAAMAELGIVAAGPGQPVGELSGGNQQKVVMARALATDPKVLVLINPTAGVDVKSKEALLGVADRARVEGRAVVIVSDELDDLRLCDRVLVMVGGRLVAEHAAGWHDHDLVASIEGVGVSR